MTVLDTPQYPTHNEFRSDTFTVPTQSMLDSAYHATFGDSVYKEDQSTLDLESYMCQLTGKEAALFCVSGTLSNQVGLRANLYQPPYSVLCDYRSHVYLHEAGGLATLSQAMVHPVVPANGNHLTLDDVLRNYTPDNADIHAAPTKVISLENTLHGIVMPIEHIRQISQFARDNGIKLHLDGARLWNASVETGVSIKEYCSYFDSVSLCLSKSLAAPMGSILVGSRVFVEKANHFKKQNGGGIRQAGMMTAMALTAIKENMPRLHVAHEYARDVGRFCTDHGIKLESPVDTNFVFLDMAANRMSQDRLIAIGHNHNIKIMGNRISFTFQNSQESVDVLKDVILECYKEAQVNPYYGIASNKQLYNYKSVLRSGEETK
ncbi:Threonine aldolase [Yamadazyma tenuis]|uniref:low-specificity L-threonine aldolase n=1 Tax=Candida tenuis (strain ATCC 10573 / BCRC 21748 / CBS 615 / JCM 9827 / NBRC 10315 / NRRL Y-1498 / VKM Y-70) TaxID=590646 RepID=G3B5A7_CANTC|nr:threonine aldolase [Yamadazyma tenuis ATCC 10573]XP_006687370.1 uncharacterized protein CANTEDRAFT_114493 [Yamadazyma tenuis ATCC 10573]EGV63576.1 threonine aldolase [Yamadazyma tenuis ATCC 10573]EGV63577.1 hypothetical protein CANTEDRAFT_114493 [Yamadazyma tenuis ATCC 10573]WEJ97006.1 Threonine aldolase [Yamadazyma tenuis]